MPRVPSGITSPPEVPGQPYNAQASSGVPNDQSAPTTVYNSVGGPGSSDPWPKIQEGGAINMTTGEPTGRWPDNGASSDGGWNQT